MSLNVDRENTAFTFKGGMLPMTVMELSSADPEEVEAQLSGKVSQSPAFFQHTPVVLSVEKVDGPNLALERLCAICRSHKLLPVAVRGGGESAKQSAWALGLGWFPPVEARTHTLAPVPDAEPAVAEPVAAETLVAHGGRVYRGTVRSGQQISAPEGDLVVVGAVNAGAEILAAGSIHVYGPLRGRALAGIHGDTDVGVFCHELHAELLSVSGNYKRLEDIDPVLLGKAIQVYLEKDHLHIEAL
ncbi:septum site-determining protein MinC [Larsenimonas suaedae]|uniref:Probable septum site-determining protein MinC n=1 Tax=Larsenimonas suaedae TaxID=1851019 RepID=A0ABU1GX23_9GAMM|nr:septum site-determining protein MinC [Larsenimonas suaedae]MCM2973163.1 septum site-determining protein MinC [Larsenimonas suaedae]MDR5896600.1 septum site-determining protein MinC [Larsenimonas suaedae]